MVAGNCRLNIQRARISAGPRRLDLVSEIELAGKRFGLAEEKPGDRGAQVRSCTSTAVWNRLGILVACGSFS